MKFLICTSDYEEGKHGVASYVHDFIDAFYEGNEFVVLTNDKGTSTDPKIRVCFFPMQDYSVPNALKFIDIIKNEEPDIILNSGFDILALTTPFLPDKCKVVSVSHFVNGYLAWVAGLNGNYADSIISLSTYGKFYIDRLFNIKDKEKTVFIPNFMKAADNTDQYANKFSNKRLCIVYPGGTSYWKSSTIVCHALNNLLKTDLQFDFYWLGNTNLPGSKWPLTRTKKLQQCMDSSDPRVKHIGLLPRNEAQNIIASANIFLLPSRGEGCPISLLEAMRYGCIPIISDAKHGSLNIIRNRFNGFVVKQDSVSELTAQIKDIIVNHSKYGYIYNNSKDDFEKNYEREKWIIRMLEVINKSASHLERVPFSEMIYKKGLISFKFLMFKNWIKDRFCWQLYQVLYFRYLANFVK